MGKFNQLEKYKEKPASEDLEEAWRQAELLKEVFSGQASFEQKQTVIAESEKALQGLAEAEAVRFLDTKIKVYKRLLEEEK